MSDAAGSPSPASPIVLRLAGHTDVGQVREHNEDNFLVADLASGERNAELGSAERPLAARGAVFGVCDGMGGAAAGEVASQLAVDLIFERLSAEPAPRGRDELAKRLVEAVEQAGVRIFHNARNDRSHRGMGTTATIGVLMDDRLFLAQVGDSRAYIYRGNQLTLVTRDQSLVNQLIEAGQLTEQEADSFEHNNIILQALGTAETVQVDLTYVDLRRGDTLLMCSDGLSGMIKADDLREVLSSEDEPSAACRKLIDKANDAGGHDNITTIVVKFSGDGLQSPSASDAPLAYRKYPLAEREKRRDTARPGSIHPSSSPPPRPSQNPSERSLKVGHTMLGVASPFAEVMRTAEATAATGKPKEGTPVAGDDPSSSDAMHDRDPGAASSGAWAPHHVGMVVTAALLLIAWAGFWFLR
jgi:protein phosphatase